MGQVRRNAVYRLLHGAPMLGVAKHGLSNAALEGNNSRVRGISQRGHGYRNPDNLMQILYFSCCP